MLRTLRTRVLIRKLGLAFALILSFVAIWIFTVRSSDEPIASTESRNQSDQSKLDQSLLSAVRDGDRGQVQHLLQQGANANARDDAGDTAIMRAALYADVEMMGILIERGADIRTKGLDGTAPLLRTTHDVEKMRLLLERGAPVDDFVMVAAASVPCCRSALELLVAHGGKGGSAGHAYTPLMAAAGHGDLDAVIFLLDHGANVKSQSPTGFTALIGAALSGNAKLVALLLERGADPNAVCKLERGILQTPAGVAASMGHADCLRLLMAAGADVNIQGGPFLHTALIGAATTPSRKTVEILLEKANITATDWTGETAVDWAARRGETDVVRLLREAQAAKSNGEPVKPPSPPDKAIPQQRPIGPDSVRRAVASALPLLQQSERTITQTRNCVSCHQHSLVSMTVSLARQQAFRIDETIASEERDHVLKDMTTRLRPLLLGTGIDPTLSVHVLAGMAAEGEPASRVTDALIHYLVLRQRKEGHWQQENYRPPDEASDFQFTALAIRGLEVYASKGRKREITTRIDRARRWLQNTEPVDTTDRSFQLLGLGWSRAEPEVISKMSQMLLSEQRADGGWAQLPSLPSDAYATGLALYSLHVGGGVAVDQRAYQRGVEFLLRTQMADGSWYVATRSFPFVEFSKSGFPHGRSQFISASATCWATMALMFATPSSPK